MRVLASGVWVAVSLTVASIVTLVARHLRQRRILRWPKVGWASGMGGICQVPVTGTTVSRLIGTSMTVGMSERIASR